MYCRRHFHLSIIIMLMPLSQISAAPGLQNSQCRLKSCTPEKKYPISNLACNIFICLLPLCNNSGRKGLCCLDGCWCSVSWIQLSTTPSRQHSWYWLKSLTRNKMNCIFHLYNVSMLMTWSHYAINIHSVDLNHGLKKCSHLADNIFIMWTMW